MVLTFGTSALLDLPCTLPPCPVGLTLLVQVPFYFLVVLLPTYNLNAQFPVCWHPHANLLCRTVGCSPHIVITQFASPRPSACGVRSYKRLFVRDNRARLIYALALLRATFPPRTEHQVWTTVYCAVWPFCKLYPVTCIGLTLQRRDVAMSFGSVRIPLPSHLDPANTWDGTGRPARVAWFLCHAAGAGMHTLFVVAYPSNNVRFSTLHEHL